MAKLITFAYLRSETDISQNIDDKYLDNPIKRAQEQLKFLIGKSFYSEIVSQNDSTSLSIDNSALYDPYIKQFLAWQAYEYWLIKANVVESRTGLRVHKEEHSDVASDKAMGELIRTARQWTQQYKGELLSYLYSQQNEDSAKYPLYNSKGSPITSTGFSVTAISKKSTTSFNISTELRENGS